MLNNFFTENRMINVAYIKRMFGEDFVRHLTAGGATAAIADNFEFGKKKNPELVYFMVLGVWYSFAWDKQQRMLLHNKQYNGNWKLVCGWKPK